MKKKKVIELLSKEIEWCRKNPQNMPEDWCYGFIQGLLQAQKLIAKTPIKLLE
jgi:hypothetical protein